VSAPAQALSLQTADGLSLEAEWSAPDGASATAVLCHPHPQYGGTMRSIVISALFEALPGQGVACLRFNFRGVEASEGAHSEGREEPLDILAALDAADARRTSGPLLLIGWSFGGDMALGVDDPRITAWIGIAPPLRFRPEREYDAVGLDARPKLLVLAAHDEYRTPDEITQETQAWQSTRVETIAGASHFFVGRTDRVVALVGEFIAALNAAI
jgi:alpha/beta superfamily hydrolase